MPPHQEDISVQANVSLKTSIIEYIDEVKVGHGYKTRSDYVQSAVCKDIKFGKIDKLFEILALLIFPMLYFGFFMVTTVITGGTLFFLFMGISGVIAVGFAMYYYKKTK